MPDPAVLQYLAQHGAPATRQAVAANPATPARINRLLADDEDEDVRAELAVKIARLMPGLRSAKAPTPWRSPSTLWNAWRATPPSRCAPSWRKKSSIWTASRVDVALSLARDVEALVAAPILEYSPLLSDTDLIEIIACGQVQEVLTAIASRQPVSEAVSDKLVQSLDVPAVAALLVNPDARIRKETMDRIVEQAERSKAWHLPLALRADLSARAIRRIGGFVGASMLERLAARDDLTDATRTHLNRHLRARLDRSADAESRPTCGRRLRRRGEGGRHAGRRLCRERGVGRPTRDCGPGAGGAGACPGSDGEEDSQPRSAKPLVALVWHAHLSMRVAFKIQTSVMKLPAATCCRRAAASISPEQGRDALASRLFRYSRLRRHQAA